MRRLFLLMLLCLALAVPVGAQTPAPPVSDDEVNRVAKGMFCPVCENVPLDVCPTQACIQWRADIRERLAAGWTEADIKTYFAEQYGDRVLAVPPPTGLNLLIYLLPPVTLVLGGWGLWRYLGQRRAPAVPPAAPAAPPADDYARRLEEELRQRQ